MALTLYRKYRPQRFADLVGQRHVATTLTSELANSRIAHAYLFIGPRGIGKTTTARIFAKAVNCAKPDGVEPDNRCPSCVGMNEGRSLDLIEIDAASHTQVEHVRESILPAARTAPTTGKYKVFIIDEVHMLSASSFNALLKVLEEPPAHVIFILATTEPHRVPATIISRCQRFDFHRVGLDDIVKRLASLVDAEGATADRVVLERVARSASGSLRDAESLLGQILGLGERRLTNEVADLVLPRSNADEALALIDEVTSGQVAEALGRVQRLLDEGVHVIHFFRECIDTLRSVLLVRLGLERYADLEPSDIERARAIAARCSPGRLTGIIDVFVRRSRDAKDATVVQLPLELAVVESTQSNEPSDNGRTSPITSAERPVAPASPQPRRRSTSSDEPALSLVWTKVIDVVRATNPSVALLLNSGQARGMVDGCLTLAFAYAFHRERLLDRRNRQLVEDALTTVLGQAGTIEVEVDSSISIPTPPAERPPGSTPDVWAEALRAFGGSAAESGSQTQHV